MGVRGERGVDFTLIGGVGRIDGLLCKLDVVSHAFECVSVRISRVINREHGKIDKTESVTREFYLLSVPNMCGATIVVMI